MQNSYMLRSMPELPTSPHSRLQSAGISCSLKENSSSKLVFPRIDRVAQADAADCWTLLVTAAGITSMRSFPSSWCG